MSPESARWQPARIQSKDRPPCPDQMSALIGRRSSLFTLGSNRLMDHRRARRSAFLGDTPLGSTQVTRGSPSGRLPTLWWPFAIWRAATFFSSRNPWAVFARASGFARAAKCCRDATNARRCNRRGRNGNRSLLRRAFPIRTHSNNTGALLLLRRNKRCAGISCFSPRDHLNADNRQRKKQQILCHSVISCSTSILDRVAFLIRVIRHQSASEWSQAERILSFLRRESFTAMKDYR